MAVFKIDYSYHLEYCGDGCCSWSCLSTEIRNEKNDVIYSLDDSRIYFDDDEPEEWFRDFLDNIISPEDKIIFV